MCILYSSCCSVCLPLSFSSRSLYTAIIYSNCYSLVTRVWVRAAFFCALRYALLFTVMCLCCLCVCLTSYQYIYYRMTRTLKATFPLLVLTSYVSSLALCHIYFTNQHIQKIRTIELNGKTIKLQIVSTVKLANTW